MTAWRDIKSSSAEIEFAAPQGVRDVIASLGRTEDIRFSPDNRRLAVAAFIQNRIAIFDVEIRKSAAGKVVALTGVVEISSSSLRRPHGLDFLDDETLIVASREGDAAIFRLPAGGAGCQACELAPIQVMRAGGSHGLNAPGSVCVAPGDRRRKEILVCNNSANSVTRHALDLDAGCLVASSGVVLEKRLDVPDGVGVSRDGRWIAVSNHNTHNVLLFENSPELNRGSDPDGILRCVHYPHGLRFAADDEYIFVADAGAPYVHIYARDSQDWRGVRNPAASFRIMDDALFQRGRHNPQEGGPKGIDIDGGMNVLVATSECQPLVFFDLSAMLGSLPGLDAAPELFVSARREQLALQIRYEFEVLEHARPAQARAEARATRAKAKLAALKRSASWRMTAPLRWAHSALRRLG